MKRWTIPSLLLLGLLVSACSKGTKVEMAESMSLAKNPVAGSEMAADSGRTEASSGGKIANISLSTAAIERSVIRSATLSLRVDKIQAAERKVHEIVKSTGGYLEGTESNDLAGDHPTMALTLRVPAQKFEATMDALAGLGTPMTKVVKSEDVTRELVDMGARLKALRAQESATVEILSRCRSLQDTLTVREQLTRIRSEIEQIDGQRQAMSNLAQLSTIKVELAQSAATSASTEDPNWLSEAWGSSSQVAASGFREVVRFGINLLVFAPFWVPFTLLAIWGWKRMVRWSKSSPTQPTA